MKSRYKAYFKLNLTSLFFMALSFVSVTLAWFAYSGVLRVRTEVNVKAWNIEISKDGKPVTHNLVMSLSDLYPGMEPQTEYVTLRNLGDSDAEISYDILSARILGDKKDHYILDEEEITSEKIMDVISQDYPFNINVKLSKKYMLSKGEEETFEITVSWPLDSEDDELDSYWGNKAHEFQENEALKKNNDPSYEVKASIQVDINLTAGQYLDDDSSSDPRYNLGDEILIDVINNNVCSSISDTCIKSYIIDENNTLGDKTVTLLPNPFRTYNEETYHSYKDIVDSYQTAWNVPTRALNIEDLLKVVSKDIKNSYISIPGISNRIIGNLSYENRLNTILNKVESKNGKFIFNNQEYLYLTSSKCYWIDEEYNNEKAFAVIKENETRTKIYPENKNALCHIIPVIEMNKTNL